jgi:hypothetical protein
MLAKTAFEYSYRFLAISPGLSSLMILKREVTRSLFRDPHSFGFERSEGYVEVELAVDTLLFLENMLGTCDSIELLLDTCSGLKLWFKSLTLGLRAGSTSK